MKVAFLSREPSVYPGGDVLSIVDLMEALRPLGVEAEYIYGHWSPNDLERFDLVHIRHVNFSWSKINFDGVIKSGKPYVVTPCFYPSAQLGATKEMMWKWLSNAKAILPFTNKEMEVMREFFGWSGSKVKVIPSGTHLRFHHSENQIRSGVLVVSPRLGSKNEAIVQEIVKELGLPLVMATRVPHVLMPAVYAHSLVFVNASESDRMSRTIGEALCAGCRVLATTENWGNEWYGEHLAVISPMSPELMRESIYHTYYGKEWDYSPNAEARKLTWASVAEQVKKAYEEVLGE